MLKVDLNSPTPLAEQIRLGIRHAIATGELHPGDPLPTVRQLAADLGINFNTVARAYQLLEGDGLAATLRGRGTMVKAARAIPPSGDEGAQCQWLAELRNALASARLAGLSREKTESIVSTEANLIWPKES